MIVITTRTPNRISIEVVQNGKHTNIISEKEFNVIQSEQLTASIIDLSNVKLISYVEVKEEIPPKEESNRKKRKHNNNQQEEQPTLVVEEVPADDSQITDDSETESK